MGHRARGRNDPSGVSAGVGPGQAAFGACEGRGGKASPHSLGAVGTADLAPDRPFRDEVVEVDEGRKGALVGTILAALCSDGYSQPVANSGWLHQWPSRWTPESSRGSAAGRCWYASTHCCTRCFPDGPPDALGANVQVKFLLWPAIVAAGRPRTIRGRQASGSPGPGTWGASASIRSRSLSMEGGSGVGALAPPDGEPEGHHQIVVRPPDARMASWPRGTDGRVQPGQIRPHIPVRRRLEHHLRARPQVALGRPVAGLHLSGPRGAAAPPAAGPQAMETGSVAVTGSPQEPPGRAPRTRGAPIPRLPRSGGTAGLESFATPDSRVRRPDRSF